MFFPAVLNGQDVTVWCADFLRAWECSLITLSCVSRSGWEYNGS